MTGRPEIVIAVLVGLAALGLAVVVWSLRRRRRCRRLGLLAARAAEQGRSGEALGLLLKAEKSWAFNAHNGSRSSLLTDLEDLSGILGQLARLGVDSAGDGPLAQVRRSVERLRSLLSDRANFGIDGRMMKREAAVRWSRVYDEFGELRQALRRGLERMKADAEPGATRSGGRATPSGDSGIAEGPPSVS